MLMSQRRGRKEREELEWWKENFESASESLSPAAELSHLAGLARFPPLRRARVQLSASDRVSAREESRNYYLYMELNTRRQSACHGSKEQ